MISTSSLSKLIGVHPDLVGVVHRAHELAMADGMDFIVTEGARTHERQKLLYAKGASRTLDSRHIPDGSGLGHAVDLAAMVDGEVRWDWPLYDELVTYMLKAAAERKVNVTWGGAWTTFRDGPHYELSRFDYPKVPENFA